MPDDLITPPPVDAERLLSLVADIRRTINVDDPASLYYRRPDLVAEAETRLKATMFRAGVSEPQPPTLLQAAPAAHDRVFSAKLNPGLATFCNQRCNTLAASGSDLNKATQELRQQVGNAAYDELVNDAQAAVTELLAPAVKADLFTLRILAAQGRYCRAATHLRPKG